LVIIDAKGVINQASRWLHSICTPAEARTLTDFAARYGDKELHKHKSKREEFAL